MNREVGTLKNHLETLAVPAKGVTKLFSVSCINTETVCKHTGLS